MANKFIEKHRRKSVLAALLFVFQGRGKYIAIMLMVTILSLPFVVSSEMLSHMIELRPVAAFLRSIGMSSVVSSINPKYSNDLLKAAMDKAAEDSQNNSFWNKFLKSINATLPPAGSPSSMALIRGGIEGGLPEVKDPKTKGPVKGVVNEEERSRGETGDEVNLQSLLAGGPGAGGPGADGQGLYGDLMAQNLAERSGNGPYAGSGLMGGPGAYSPGNKAAGMFNSVYNQAGAKVPMPGKPQKVNTKRMGRVSGFTWKNVGYNKKNAKVDVKTSSQRPMFQLAQTFSMTATAYKSKTSEYQAAYTGSTYDGNDVNADVIETPAEAVTMPNTGMTAGLLEGAGGMQDAAKKCSDSQGTHGAKMSEDGKLMDDTSKTLGKPPKCCSHGAVDSWNGKIDKIISYCQDFNVHEAQLSADCQSQSKPMDCNSYNSMHISKCSKWKCFLSIILAILFIVIGLMTGQLWLAAMGVGMLMSQLFPGWLGTLLSAVLGGAFGLFAGLDFVTKLVVGTASQILSGMGEEMPAEDE